MDRKLPYMNAFGTADITTAKTINEALEMAGLNWEVESRPIFNEVGAEYDSFRANVRTSDDRLLGVVTDKYQIVQNNDAFKFVDNLVDEGFQFEAAGQFRGGRSIWVMGQLPESKILGDDIANRVVFTNTHDGTSGVRVMMTPVRLICSNMLNLALKKADRIWATKHTGQIETRLEEAKYTLGLANKYMTELNTEAERLVEIKLSDNDIEAIFDVLYPTDEESSTKKLNNIAIMKDNFIQCYNAEDIKQFKGTAYGAVNAMSDLVSHKVPGRLTDNYYENVWSRLINGYSDLDKFYKAVALK